MRLLADAKTLVVVVAIAAAAACAPVASDALSAGQRSVVLEDMLRSQSGCGYEMIPEGFQSWWADTSPPEHWQGTVTGTLSWQDNEAVFVAGDGSTLTYSLEDGQTTCTWG